MDNRRTYSCPVYRGPLDNRACRKRDGVYSAVVIALAIVISGCGRQRPGPVTVCLEGSVTVKGLAVPSGSIIFVSEGGGQATSGAIRDGRYLADKVPVGTVRVLFSALQETGKVIDDGGRRFPERVSIIPRGYSDGISMAIDEGSRRHDFGL